MDAPSELQSDYLSDQGPTQVQSRQRVCGRCNVVDPGQDPPFLLCVDHCQTLLPQKSGHSLILLVVASGDAHPVVEVCHNVRCASSWRVLQRFPEPLCETVQCLCTGRSAARVLRLWVPETSRISLMACASPPREKSFWRPLAADLHDVSVDADQFHDTLALENDLLFLGAFPELPEEPLDLVLRWLIALRHFSH